MEGGVVEELCTPDTVSPAQFQELWSGTPERSAEFKLALAVLEQALEDFEKHSRARNSEAQRLYRHAHTWVLSNDRRWPYSFVNVCEMLNISSGRVRTHLLATRDRELGAESAATPACDTINEGATDDRGVEDLRGVADLLTGTYSGNA